MYRSQTAHPNTHNPRLVIHVHGGPTKYRLYSVIHTLTYLYITKETPVYFLSDSEAAS